MLYRKGNMMFCCRCQSFAWGASLALDMCAFLCSPKESSAHVLIWKNNAAIQHYRSFCPPTESRSEKKVFSVTWHQEHLMIQEHLTFVALKPGCQLGPCIDTAGVFVPFLKQWGLLLYASKRHNFGTQISMYLKSESKERMIGPRKLGDQCIPSRINPHVTYIWLCLRRMGQKIHLLSAFFTFSQIS